MYVNVHRSGEDRVISICDESLVGRTFAEGDFLLDVRGSFYQGESKTKEEVKEYLREGGNLNVVGEESVQCCLEEGLIDESNVKRIQGVPFVFIVSLQ